MRLMKCGKVGIENINAKLEGPPTLCNCSLENVQLNFLQFSTYKKAHQDGFCKLQLTAKFQFPNPNAKLICRLLMYPLGRYQLYGYMEVIVYAQLLPKLLMAHISERLTYCLKLICYSLLLPRYAETI